MPNPLPSRFLELLDGTEGLVLNCGGGGVVHERVIALDRGYYADNDVQGDGLALPFRTGTFALVLSQAVVEHVTDPQAYIDELIRVLAPDGVLFVEAAFMQPVHLAPDHYYNVTRFGLAHLCRALVDLTVEGMGSLAESWDWVGAEAGAHEVLTRREFTTVRSAMAKVDAAMTIEQLANVAPGVRLIGRKR